MSYQKSNPAKTIYGKKRVKVRSTPGHYATKKRSVEITMHLGLDNIIKGRFLEFQSYHNFVNLFSKLSESTFYKEMSKFQ